MLEDIFNALVGAGGTASLSSMRLILGDAATGPMKWPQFETAATEANLSGEAALLKLVESLGGSWSPDDVANALDDLLDPAVRLQLNKLPAAASPAQLVEWLLSVRARIGHAKPTFLRDALSQLRRSRGPGARAIANLQRAATASTISRRLQQTTADGQPASPASRFGAVVSAAKLAADAERRAAGGGGTQADLPPRTAVARSPPARESPSGGASTPPPPPPPPPPETRCIETQTDSEPVKLVSSAETQATPPPRPVADVGVQSASLADLEKARAIEHANEVEHRAVRMLQDRHAVAGEVMEYLHRMAARQAHLAADIDVKVAVAEEESRLRRKELALARLRELEQEEARLVATINAAARAAPPDDRAQPPPLPRRDVMHDAEQHRGISPRVGTSPSHHSSGGGAPPSAGRRRSWRGPSVASTSSYY